MTVESLQAEIDALDQKRAQLTNDLILTDGAIQAFRYMQQQLRAVTAAADVDPLTAADTEVGS